MITRVLVFSSILAIGCGTTTVGGDGIIPNPDLTEATLEIVGSTTVTMSERSETDLIVRYLDGDRAPVDGFVNFVVNGDAAGASLGGRNIQTDSDGLATINLRSGTIANFQVTAAAAAADPVNFNITVTDGEIVTLTVTPEYAGSRRVSDIDVGIFTNYRCPQFADLVPTPSEVKDTRIGRSVEFEGIDTASPTAIYALGYNGDGNVAIFRCVDFDASTMEYDVTVDMADVLDIEGGVFDMTETFDVTEGLPGPLNFLLGAMTGIATDPGGWLIDLALDSGILPGWAQDLLMDSRPLIRGYLSQAIDSINRPGYVDQIIEGGAAIDGVFNSLTLVGTLTISEADEFGEGFAIHRLTELRVPVGEEMISRPLNQRADDVPVVFNDGMQSIAPHTFAISFGEILEIVLNEVILPRVTCPDPDDATCTPAMNLGDVLARLISCEGLASADWLPGGESEAVRDTVELVCDTALSWAGSQIGDLVTDALDYDTLTLSGEGMSIDGNTDYRADMFEGTADAVWSGGPGGSLDFMGDLTGDRDGEPVEREIDRVKVVFDAAIGR